MGGKYKNLDSEALSIVWRQRTAMETLTLDHLMRLIVGKYVPHRIHSQDQGDPTPEDRHNPIFQRDDLYAEDDDMGMGGEGGLAGAEPYTHAEAEGLVSSLAHCRSRDGAMSSASGHGDVDSDMRGDGVVGVEQFQAEPTQAQEVEDELVCLDDVVEGSEKTSTNATVKMKLGRFCHHEGLRRKLNSIAIDTNRLVAEAVILSCAPMRCAGHVKAPSNSARGAVCRAQTRYNVDSPWSLCVQTCRNQIIVNVNDGAPTATTMCVGCAQGYEYCKAPDKMHG